MSWDLVTTPQVGYIRGLQAKLKLPDRVLDGHCERRFGVTFAELTKSQASALIDEMAGWNELPATLAIAKGQTVLPGFDPGAPQR